MQILPAVSEHGSSVFFVLSLGSNQYRAGSVYDLCVCVHFNDRNTRRRLNRKWFWRSRGIEPATPGLQGIAWFDELRDRRGQISFQCNLISPTRFFYKLPFSKLVIFVLVKGRQFPNDKLDIDLRVCQLLCW